MPSEKDELVRFAGFSSSADASFWKTLSDRKLNDFKLDKLVHSIYGQYAPGYRANMPSRLSVSYQSFATEAAEVQAGQNYLMRGLLKSSNTLEEFKTQNFKAAIRTAVDAMVEGITSGAALSDNTAINQFVVFTHSNLKKYKYYYWFATPAILPREPITLQHAPQKLPDILSESEVAHFATEWERLHAQSATLFCGIYKQRVAGAHDNGDSAADEHAHTRVFHPLTALKQEDFDDESVLFCFADPAAFEKNPGWPLRNLIALLSYHGGAGKTVRVVCYRHRTHSGIVQSEPSIVLTVTIPEYEWASGKESFVTGLEKNARGQNGPRSCDLASSMDPTKLAESAAALNLRLMRWRLLPQIDLERIASTKCLLLGSGTLGCNVARCLLGWGVKTITFVDSGKVSYSNPVRQSLFKFEDSINGGKPKATAAAERLREIFPSIEACGVQMHIPMPGHPVGESETKSTMDAVERLAELIKAHDAVFLLMDTKESRWLPTLIAAVEGKMCFTCALGFDTYVAMRHGVHRVLGGGGGDEETSASSKMPSAPVVTTSSVATQATGDGDRGDDVSNTLMTAGCYFCNDVNQPQNTMRDRTMDQQCTVSRPGVSMIASALVTELMVALIHHPLGPACGYDEPSDDDATVLGVVPQQLRGSLSTMTTALIGGCPSPHCTACSSKIVSLWREDPTRLVMGALNQPNFLEEVSGVDSLKKMMDEFDDLDLDFSDDDNDDDDADEDA